MILTKPRIQKSTCTYLKAVNRQNLGKFKNMGASGVMNGQCEHGVICISVDLQRGEKSVRVRRVDAYKSRLLTCSYRTDTRIRTSAYV